ncbi:NAD-dependent epimerase/dehydratase family protein [Robiginitalea marina]|uniref:NAD-dependent epimerase/dehydratase family protein n=1 Tax=Robiginitalea marina TaxID=2954105 RepID=A0ABT1AZW3_9FLAO|nr:NAD-dependent epimerase/dehydratase family protein [Robiginitalea marina]MCO5725120.1 NAD-dependent epimerase/dehydratase family protein [Robiginitalea marina]
MPKKILILGACGQIGTELTLALRARHGAEAIIATDIREGQVELMASGPFSVLDATDFRAVEKIVQDHKVEEVYLMAAMLSATAEKSPSRAWELNMNSLFHVLELARQQQFAKLFWPSSIAVFGPSTPKDNTPQYTVTEPTTVYGISKLAGEGWCSYYHRKHGVDVRSLRYPGLISWKAEPGGGTTDYAVEIYHEALAKGQYECFLREQTRLPMMYMEDAIRATLELMEAPATRVTIRNSYNLGAMSFTPAEMAESIREHLPGFRIGYRPDFRQEIAASWPERIDDSKAREDWGWEPRYTLQDTTREMLTRLRDRL